MHGEPSKGKNLPSLLLLGNFVEETNEKVFSCPHSPSLVIVNAFRLYTITRILCFRYLSPRKTVKMKSFDLPRIDNVIFACIKIPTTLQNQLKFMKTWLFLIS